MVVSLIQVRLHLLSSSAHLVAQQCHLQGPQLMVLQHLIRRSGAAAELPRCGAPPAGFSLHLPMRHLWGPDN
jgi:hypothetical protein